MKHSCRNVDKNTYSKYKRFLRYVRNVYYITDFIFLRRLMENRGKQN